MQTYSTHYIKKLGKSLEPFFHKVQKNDFSKISKIYQKNTKQIFEMLWCPNFMPSLKKSLEQFPNKKKLYFGTDIIIIRVIRGTNVN